MNNQYFMDWPGPVHPYVRTTQRQKWCDPRYKKYQAFKTAFRLAGNCAGMPNVLDKGLSYRLICNLYTEGAARYDLDNALKGIMDALWAQDKQIKEVWAKLHEHKAEDHTTVCLEVIQ